MRFGSNVFLVCIAILLCGCSGEKPGVEAKNMDQLQTENGLPVYVRTITKRPFSVYLKYPAEFRAKRQSTAYAKIPDVVRKVLGKVGDRVERDQAIVLFSEDNAAYQQAKLGYESAQSAFNRVKVLYEDAGISKQDYDSVKTQFDMAREGYKSASELIRIKAPIDGIITQLNVQTSTNVAPGMALFTVSNDDGYEAQFFVTADEIDEIRTGARTIIENRNERIEGRITEISLIMDPVHRALPVRASFAGKPKTLVSGMSVDVIVETYKNENAIVVERNEMQKKGSSWIAYVRNGTNAEARTLSIGREQGFSYEIQGGLKEGDILITEGVGNISDGAHIQVVERTGLVREESYHEHRRPLHKTAHHDFDGACRPRTLRHPCLFLASGQPIPEYVSSLCHDPNSVRGREPRGNRDADLEKNRGSGLVDQWS